MGRDPEEKLKEAILMLDVLALVEALADDICAARDSLAEQKIDELKLAAPLLIDFRRECGLPEYSTMLAEAEEAGEEYAVSPEARRRRFHVIQGEKDDESTEEAVSGDQPEAEG